MNVSVLSGSRATQAEGGRASPLTLRGCLVVVVAVAMAGGFLATDTNATVQAVSAAGPDLTRLMRAMAGLKAMMAVSLVAVVLWRLGAPASWPRFVAYAVVCSAMTAGPGMIWNMHDVVAGAVALHGGLLACVVLLWRDPAVGQRLDAAIALRRARLAGRS